MKTLTSRSIIAFAILILFLSGVGFYSLVTMRDLAGKLYVINEVNSVKQRYAINYRGSVHDRSVLIRDVVLARDPVDRQASLLRISRLQAFYAASETQMQVLFSDDIADLPEEVALLSRIRAIEAKTLPVITDIVTNMEAGRRRTAEDLLLKQARPYFIEWLTAINQFIDVQEASNKSVGAKVDAETIAFKRNIVLLIAASIFISLVFLVINASALRPLGRVTRVIERVAQGDLDATPGSGGFGEIGELQRAADTMLQTLSRSIEEREQLARAEANAREEQAQLEARHAAQAAEVDRQRLREERALAAERRDRAEQSERLERELQAVIGKARKGDFGDRIMSDFSDPSLIEMKHSVNAVLQMAYDSLMGTMGFLSMLSQGRLDARFEGEFEGAFAELQRDANSTAKTLDNTISRIIERSLAISQISAEIASSAEGMSRRTERNAVTLEETVAALNELTALIRATAQNAERANTSIQSAKAEAEVSNQVMTSTVEAMTEIQDFSNQISRTTGVINEIAFQTNLLALNAGVEAARAGEAGRGFSVVASEVRALSQRASEASNEIENLINRSSDQVKRGVDLVAGTGAAIRKMIKYIDEIAVQMSDITSSSADQAAGVSEVNAAAIELDRATQQNAMMYEETSSSVMSLQQISDQLSEMMASFETSNGTLPESVAWPGRGRGTDASAA
ncbi:methyl-accepting chemotaxis protein [Actibacterium sp. 188UL27-1]|uniref:HAMP domain-containing methyl-accepting chemotaxis protein n=1 Tax=Actibacterium sp. 188UL27-1 TaxID=2786961 RepID=UPI00195D8EF9|nr:MCP four helix bundle domain-containing protein [Actibacterium sp. 188UL27-1]